MYYLKYLLVFFSYFVLVTKAFDVASIITPCRMEDKACIISSTQNAIKPIAAGIPELGVSSFDPISLDVMHCDEHDLKITLDKSNARGFSSAKVIDVERNPDSFKLVVETPFFLSGKYDAQGKMLFVPVTGNGDFEFNTDKVRLSLVTRYKYVERDGKKYWKVTGFDYTYDLIDKFHMKFDNLFNGDETLAKPINDILNNNWREIVTELGGCFIEKVLTQLYNNINNFFDSTPTDTLEIV